MTFDRYAIRPACERSRITLRTWQRQALHLLTLPDTPDYGIITAIMGAGKSVVIALLCSAWSGPVVVTAPTIALVDQLSATIEAISGESVGRLYTGGKSTERITVVCLPSIDLAPREPGTLWIADECHRTDRAPVAEFDEFAHFRIGFSATPRGSLWQFEHMRYTVADALRDGVLVPMRVHYLTGKGKGHVDRNEACVEWIAKQTGPGVVSADSIADAEDFTEALNDAGVPALCIHSRLPAKTRKAAMRALESGTIRALAHVRMLVEGVDLPWLRWLCLRSPRATQVAFAQEIGRVLRAYPGKTHADIFDPYGVTLEHELQDVFAVCDAAPIESEPADPPPEPFIDPLTGEEFEKPTAIDRKKIQTRSEGAAYVAQCLMALKQHGIAPPGSGATGLKGWRRDLATEKQLAILAKTVKQARFFVQNKGRVDDLSDAESTHARAIALQVTRAHAIADKYPLRKGYVSDLITVLFATIRTQDHTARARAYAAIAHIEPPA